jgi:hypothetical protein
VRHPQSVLVISATTGAAPGTSRSPPPMPAVMNAHPHLDRYVPARCVPTFLGSSQWDHRLHPSLRVRARPILKALLVKGPLRLGRPC